MDKSDIRINKNEAYMTQIRRSERYWSFPTFLLMLALLVALFWGCCPSIKESQNTTITLRDTTITIDPTLDSANVTEVQDDGFLNWIYAEMRLLKIENDSLKGLPPDTITFIQYLKSKPIKNSWSAFKVTQKGDSIWITFKYDNGDGTFVWKEIPAKIKLQITDTQTITTKEYEPSPLIKLWNIIKYFVFVIIGLVAGFVLGVLFTKFKPL